MDLQAISEAATVAIASAIVFLLAAKSWYLLVSAFSANPSFADSIMREAAQRFRDQLVQLSWRQSTYLGALLVFVVMYVVAMLFHAPELFTGYPSWQLYVLLGTLAGAAVFALYRLLSTILEWRQVSFVRDANIAVGHQLQRIAAGHGRVYHDVRTSAGIVDHVLIGQNGIYAINVVAQRHLKKGAVEVDGNRLVFSTGRNDVPIVEIAGKCARLAKELRRQTGHAIRVRSVIAVPGWDIERQSSRDHLLVNERTLPMITGWRSQADYLMNEDVESLQQYLTTLCRRRQGR